MSKGAVQYVLASGAANGTMVFAGGLEVVSSGGRAANAMVLCGGTLSIASGGIVSGLTLASQAKLIDDGTVLVSGAATLAGTLSGSGSLVKTGAGDLVLGGASAAFAGSAVISGGTIELSTAAALGKASVVFTEPSTGSAVLQIDAGDAPAADGTFANVISNFSGANDYIDLRSIAYVSGATATVSGTTLVLKEGGETYRFKLAGTIGGSFPVLSDGHGGTLIDPKVAAFVQTAASFAPIDASSLALGSGTTSSALSNLVAPVTSAVNLHR